MEETAKRRAPPLKLPGESPRAVGLLSGIIALSLIALAGCVPTFIVAHVTTVDSKPIRKASVLMDCPQVFSGNGMSRFGYTNENGDFSIKEPPMSRSISDNCEIVVRAEGFTEVRVDVEDVCLDYSGANCTRAELEVTMTPMQQSSQPGAPDLH